MIPRDVLPTLGDLRRLTETVRFNCRRCDRSGRYRLARLIERYGRDTYVHDVTTALAADCPRRDEIRIMELCQAGCPTVSDLRDQIWGPPLPAPPRPDGWGGPR